MREGRGESRVQRKKERDLEREGRGKRLGSDERPERRRRDLFRGGARKEAGKTKSGKRGFRGGRWKANEVLAMKGDGRASRR